MPTFSVVINSASAGRVSTLRGVHARQRVKRSGSGRRCRRWPSSEESAVSGNTAAILKIRGDNPLPGDQDSEVVY